MGVRPLLFAVLLVGCGSGGEFHDSAPATPRSEASEESPAERVDAGVLGDGFVVWESNRSGEWRLWTRRLDGTGLRRLTADEEGRSHCCPHVSPDGSRIAYLSLDRLGREYPGPRETGELRLLDPASGAERSLVAGARTYFENRAVVWRTAEELLFIDAEGFSSLFDLKKGSSRRLLADASDEYGWLIDATLRWSVSGRSLFGRYDAGRQSVVPGVARRGCQPYFTGDGRWGFWMPAPGGPIESVELASGRTNTVLRMSDPRLPDELGYLYFPMYSPDRRLLAFAASAGEHDHFQANYEIFVAPTDPGSLELIGAPVRLTENPATDRYPDVFLEPLPLGRLGGEAPVSVTIEPSAPASDWRWSFGDGTSADGPIGEHTFERPGNYRVEASAGDTVLRGYVSVAPPSPPAVTAARLTGSGDAIRVDFDEPIALRDPDVSLASGTVIAGWTVTDDGRALVVELEERLRRGDRLRLAGVVDQAEAPNAMGTVELELAPPLWPSTRDHLVFVWESGEAPNLVHDPEIEADRAIVLEDRGRARLDRNYAMVLGGGAFTASRDDANRTRRALQRTNELTLELLLTPEGDNGRILSFSSGGKGEDLWLEESGGEIRLGVRQGSRGPDAVARATVASVAPGRTTHLVVTYAPGRLQAYIDGDHATSSTEVQSGFFHWRSYDLTFGDESSGGADWRGRLEGVAIYDRSLDEASIRDNYLRARQRIDSRAEPRRLALEARVRRISEIPTLREITPYREALAVFEYEVEGVVDGEYGDDTVRVARWVLMDGERLALPAVGARERLVLEPYSEQPQVASVYLSDTLPSAADGAVLFYDVTE